MDPVEQLQVYCWQSTWVRQGPGGQLTAPPLPTL